MFNVSPESLIKLVAARNAARTNVALFDLSDRSQIEITGSERTRFLHSFTSNDIKRLKPEKGCETFVTNIKGKIVAHVFVFCTENALWLDGMPGQQDAIIDHLRKFVLIDDVQFVPHSSDRGELFVTGPVASSLLQLDEPGLPVGGHVTRETSGEPFSIRRVDLLGHPGFLLSIPNSQMETVKRSLIGLGITEGSPELFEIMRIEAGFPRYGVDITDDNLAQEAARTKQCISFDKGCYLGQETIARLDALGHTNRELRRMRFDTNATSVVGSLIFDETGSTEIGVVTSATNELGDTVTQSGSSVIALGHLKRTALNQDTPVRLMWGDISVSGRVL